MKFNEENNCETCKYGYFLRISDDGWHAVCGANYCYLCAQKSGRCNGYKEGSVPAGKEPINKVKFDEE